MTSLRKLILFTSVFAVAIPKLMGGHNDPYIPAPCPDTGKKCEEETTGGSSVPVVKSLEWSVSIGFSSFAKPRLDTLARTAYEKNGNLPSFKELYERSYSDKPDQRRQVHLGFAFPKIAEPVFHPSCLSIDEDSSAEVLRKQEPFFQPFIHQVVTIDSFTLVEARPGPTPDTGGGWTLWVWDRPYVMPAKVKGFYPVEDFKLKIPLTKVTFFPPVPSESTSGPQAPPEFNNLVYTQTRRAGLGGSHEIEYHIDQFIRPDKRTRKVTTKKYVTNINGKSFLSSESVDYSYPIGENVWDYTIHRKVVTAGVSGSGVHDAPVLTSSTIEVYKDFTALAPPATPAPPNSPAPVKGGGVGMKRLMSRTEAAIVEGPVVGEPQVTQFFYVDQPKNSACHGRLATQINPDGSWRRFDYNIFEGVVSIITEYSGWKDLPLGDLVNCRKEVTAVTPDAALVETYIGSVLISKSIDTIGKIDEGTINECKTATSEKWDGTAWHTTTTCYGPNGFVSWIENSDGTAITYSYGSSNIGLQITSRTGAGSRAGITSGVQVTTSMSMRNIPIAQETTDIASNLVTERWDTDLTYNGGYDRYGRPMKRIYNGNVDDYDINRYACCGLEYSRDRFGKITQYYRDGLLRIYKTETKNSENSPLVSDYTDIVGFTKTRTRSTGGQTLFLGSTSRSLDGLTTTTVEPSRKSALASDRLITTTVTQHTPLGDVVTTTFADGSTSVKSNYLDGRLRSVTGTAVADKTYDYGTHTEKGGGEMSVVRASGFPTAVPQVGPPGPATYVYKDQMSRPLKTVSPTAGTTLYNYNSITADPGSRGKLATMTDGDNVTTTYGYDAEGEPTTTARTVPLATGTATQVTTTTQDVVVNVNLHGRDLGVSRRKTQTLAATGQPTLTTSESFAAIDGLVSGSRSFGREALSVTTRPDASDFSTTTVTHPDGTKSFQRTARGRVILDQKQTAAGVMITGTTYGYDTLQRLSYSYDARMGPFPPNVFRSFTEDGQPLIISNSSGGVTSVAYDIMGQKISTTLPDGTVSHISYYPTGMVKATWGSQTYPTWLTYDEQNRQTELATWKVAPVLTPTTSTRPADCDLTRWSYNMFRGSLDSKQYADGKTVSYGYTPGGKLSLRTWARGIRTTYKYTQGLLTLTDYNDITPDVAITYDAYGRQAAVTQTAQSKITYSYNPTTFALASELIQYDLDRNGTYEFSRTLDRTRDSLLRDSGYSLKTGNLTLETASSLTYSATDGRLSQISNPQIPNQLFSYSYTPNSNLLASVSGPIHTVTNTWENRRDILDTKQNKVGTTLVSSYDYTVNNLEQRIAVATRGTAFPALPSWAWTYDPLGQVIKADSTVATSDRSYQYDTIGNRQKSANSLTLPAANNYTSNSLNQYRSFPSLASVPSYDLDGNMTTGPLPTAPTVNSNLTYDAENRLISSTKSGYTTRYRYDALSRRIAKFNGSTTTSPATVYVYDSWNCIAHYLRASNTTITTLLKTQLWGLDLSGTLQGAGGVGGLLAIFNPPHAENAIDNDAVSPNFIPANIHYPTYDGNGNISEYIEANGTIVCHFDYDPFGNQRLDWASNTILFTDILNYRFSTKPRDQETGLSYYGYRYYNPTTGRWLNRDPIAERGGLNLYGFVGNKSLDYIDTNGLFQTFMTGGFGALESAAAAFGAGAVELGASVASVTERAVIGPVFMVLGALTGTANAPGLPEPTFSELKKEECNRKYEKYKEASNKQRGKPIDGSKCCEDAKEIRDLLQEEADGRQDYIDSGCDEIIPTKAQHPTEAANKKAALERAKRKVEELCK